VVATLGRRHEILDLLHSIPPQNLDEIEVVVVDQNAEDLRPELDSFNKARPLLHLCVDFRNASAARNFGAEHARGQWVMFPDDDATYLTGTLDHVLGMIKADEFDLISGRIVDEANVPHLLDWALEPTAITPGTLEHTLVESSFAIRRDLFLRVGGFDPLFGPGAPFPSAEGADLMYRLWRQGPLRSQFTPAIALYHPAKHTPLTEAARQRIHAFAIGEGAFTARHFRVLQRMTIARKLLFRTAGTLISRGEKRLRKIAFLRGFWTGVFGYWKQRRSAGNDSGAPRRSSPR
jgi:glycosyltransferase involved in cell wall biosynthesis